MSFAFRPHRRSGLTLVEILIALTMTLIVLGTMMAAFRLASTEMQNGRALIELANRARLVDDHLRADLGSVTVETRVYDGTVEPNGYFEYVEGPVRDATFAVGGDSFQGDCDDVLCFTARSTDGVLFRGRRKNAVSVGPLALSGNIPIESSLAEIVWFTTVNDNEVAGGTLQPQLSDFGTPPVSSVDFDDSIQVRRRVLLIRPDLNMDTANPLPTNLLPAEVNNFIRNNDISVRVVANGSGTFDIVANNLSDLANRANRFAHDINNFPHNLIRELLENRVASDNDDNTDYLVAGQTWQPLPPILSDVGAFDFRAYSPTARVNDVASVIVEPSDPGYAAGSVDITQPGRGAYVDLGYNNSLAAPNGRADEWFIVPPTQPTNPASTFWSANVWDTWTPLYERDGIDQDQAGVVDQGANGVDDGGSNVIDDPGERETNPPYVQPIRAMKVTLRLVERGTKQVHQISIVHSFVPE